VEKGKREKRREWSGVEKGDWAGVFIGERGRKGGEGGGRVKRRRRGARGGGRVARGDGTARGAAAAMGRARRRGDSAGARLGAGRDGRRRDATAVARGAGRRFAAAGGDGASALARGG
jgi:hypothetical protein